jgi:ferritin
MITKILEKAIIEQVKREEHSSRIYLAMASWCQVSGYPGAAAWLYAQVEEERSHQSKFIHYLNDRGGHALLSELEKPALKFKTLLDVFQQVLEHEEYISQSINDLYAISVQQKDFSTGSFLQWFITEQIEEESTARAILDKVRMVGSEKVGLYQVDKELNTMAVTKLAAILAAASANTGA